nr:MULTISPECIES: hypothetical protein [unclassified Ciceribacter]
MVKVTRGLFVVSLVAGLSACNTSNPTSGLDVAGTQQQPAAAPVVQGVCPSIALRDGTASFRTYAKGGKDDPSKVVYQASLAETTRACTRNDAGQLSIKVMVQGRLVAGPQGKAGSLSMPIRVAVVDSGNVLYSELTKFEASLTDPATPAQFVFTKDVTGISGEVSGLTQVFVGFDEGPYNTK